MGIEANKSAEFKKNNLLENREDIFPSEKSKINNEKSIQINNDKFDISDLRNEVIKNKYNIDNKTLKEIDLIKDIIGIDFNKVIGKCDDYVKEFSKDIPEKVKEKIKKSIIGNIRKSIKEIKELKKENDLFIEELNLDLKEANKNFSENKSTITLAKKRKIERLIKENNFINQKWIINSKLQDTIGELTNKVLPSLSFYYNNLEEIDSINNSYDSQDKHGKLYKLGGNDMYRLSDKIDEIEEMIKSDVDFYGNFDKGLFSTQDILDSENDQDKKLLKGTEKIEEINLLSEKDKKIEKSVQTKYLYFVLHMVVPFVGAPLSTVSDFNDLFSDQEGTLKTMKEIGILSGEELSYQMEKTFIDNIAGAVGLLLSGVGIQVISKINKFRKLGLSDLDFDKFIKKLKNEKPKINDIISSKEKLKNGENLTELERTELAKKINENNPLFSILSNLKEGDDYETMIFTGVKGINDTYGQAFTDNVLNQFKKAIEEKYPGTNVMWDDYKNFVVKKDPGVNIPNSENLGKILDGVFEINKKQLTKNELDKAKSKHSYESAKLNVFSKSGKVEGNTQEDIITSLAKTRSNLEEKASGIKILSKRQIVDKEIELNSKYSFNSNTSEVIQDERGRTIYRIKKGILTKEFFVDGKQIINRFPIIKSDGINEEILEMVRKNYLPENMELYKEIKQLNQSRIVHGEFIWPKPTNLGNLELEPGEIIPQELLDSHNELLEKLKAGKLNKDEVDEIIRLAEYTFKGALDKETFYSKISGDGELFFIDIKGMGTINLKDFSDKINKFIKGEIKEDEIFLNSGSEMTNKFKGFIIDMKKDLSEKYPGKEIDIYIGGDEIGIFIKGRENDQDIAEIVNTNLRLNHLSGRTTNIKVNENNGHLGGEKLFEEADKLTNFSKNLEKRFTEITEELELQAKKSSEGINEKLNALSKLKAFHISKNIDGELIITFTLENGEKLFKNGNKLKLEEIFDLKTGNLLSPPNPFIQYLTDNNISRTTINE